METVLISGGTGMVGTRLCEKLKEKGYKIAILSRDRSDSDEQVYLWDIEKQEIEEAAIESADYIIHLAGANIGEKAWTIERKKLIIDSRVKTSELIFEKTKKVKNHIKAFISASAIGYYGTVTSEKIFNESDPPAHDFLGETCRLWEKAADKFAGIGIRTVKIRTALVLSEHGGALDKMIIPAKFGFGSAIGSGKQFMPWIHIDDLCGIYIKAIEDTQMNDAYNAAAPQPVTNKEFNKILASVLHRPFWFPNIPAAFMKFLFGKMSAILLRGSRVSSEKILKSGYQFKFPDLRAALTDLKSK
jgi:uncharacterized protein (TIGR01777 family)